MRGRQTVVLSVFAILAVMAFTAGFATADQRTSIPIGVGWVELNQDQLNPDVWRQTVIAFIPTGSTHDGCLVTLTESDIAMAGQTVYCGARSFNGRSGVVVHIFLPEAAPSEFVIAVSVYQPFAQKYGTPVFYDGS